MRDIQEPTLDEYGDETHPAFGKVTVSRSQVTPGASLFDSDIRHREVVSLRIGHATRKRDLNSDWIHSTRLPIIEIEMSLSQWAQLVSSFGQGDGTPVTIRYNAESPDSLPEQYAVPGLPFAPRMANQVEETVGTATRMYDNVREALAKYKEHKTVGNLRDLERTIEHVGSNVKFATTRLTEHVEQTVTRAKADVEAMVMTRARQLGLDPAEVSSPLELDGES